ncbi:MAG TPA: hypothetical protein VKA34_00730 [Balneolales bacterium]|nr:hypothetical protein [Balneolales bacterium]
MRKVTKSEIAILERLIFIEDYYTVKEETGLLDGEIRDDLINMLNSGLVQAFESDNSGTPVPVSFCDTDNLQKFYFRATNAGLKAFKQLKK